MRKLIFDYIGKFFLEAINGFMDRHLFRVLSRYQVTLTYEDKVVADVPLLSVINYGHAFQYRLENGSTWKLSIMEPQP